MSAPCDRTTPRPLTARPRPRVLRVEDSGGDLLVLIGPLRGPDHLTVLHRWRYYHVPVSAIAPSRAAVRYVAFYEPAGRFGIATGRIREYAEVLRVSRVRRADLPGLTWPAHGGADVPYYRFDLGPLRRLSRPVVNREGQRVGFRFPDLGRLLRAGTLRDLPRGAG
jgi:hypothetical protein